MAKSDCLKTVAHSRIKVEENGKKAVFVNPDNEDYIVAKVDGCLIPRGTTASDYLVVKPKVASVMIELKGKDVAHACEQLFSSVENRSVKGIIEGNLGFLVVCARYPRFDTFVAKAKQRAARTYRAGFHVVTGAHEYDIERCVAIDGPR